MVEMMKLRVMVPNLVGNETVLINVSSSSTVLELKRLLAAEISADLKIEDLKLIYLGRLLPDLSLLSYWLQPTQNSTPATHLEERMPTYLDGNSTDLLPTHPEGRDISLHPCTDSDLLQLKSDSDQHQLEKISIHTLHLAYPPASPCTLNKNSFLLGGSSNDDDLSEQQQIQVQLAELYSTYISLYWQSVISQSEEGSDLDLRRISDMLGNTAAAPPPATITPPPPPASTPPARASNPPAPASTPPPEAYLEVLWGLLTCLLHSFLIIAILHFYGSLNLVKFALAFAFACLIIFLGKEAMRNDEEVEEMVEEEEETDNAEVEEFAGAEAVELQQEGTLAILISNFSLFFSSVFPEGIHLRV